MDKLSYREKIIVSKPAEWCLVMGLWDKKNGLTKELPIDLSGKRDIVLVDIDYFVKNHNYVLSMAEGLIKRRDAVEKEERKKR